MSDTAKPTDIGPDLGPNTWLIDEMYRRYLEAPESVSATWREFFADFRPDAAPRNGNGSASPAPTSVTTTAAPTAPAPAPAPTPAPAAAKPAAAPPATAQTPAQSPAQPDGAQPLRGAAARIVANMEASLGVPTATSVRTVPAKVLEENRRLLNRAIAGRRSGKVSFTHLIGWAVVRAAAEVPSMNAGFVETDGTPAVVRHEAVNFGLAVDLRKSDGSRTLVVPNVKDAGSKSFAEWLSAYEDLIRRSQSNKLTPDDFAGTTMSLTNPGMIGTVHSVPRLMPGQGCIVGAGSLDWPVEFKGADPDTLAELGVSKVMTLTSTYDHRIIQGAESGEFLRWIEQFLLGEHDFYEGVFASLGVHHEPVHWRTDNAATTQPTDVADAAMEKAGEVLRLMNMYRVRGHLVADVNPLVSGTLRHSELDPTTYGLSVWDLDRVFPTWGLAGSRAMRLRQIIDVLRDSYCGSVGIEYMHIQDPDERRWIQERVEGVDHGVTTAEQRRILAKLNAAEAFEGFLKTKYVGHKRFGLEGSESAIPMLDRLCTSAADAGMTDVVIGMAHRGRLNVLANVIGRSYRQLFREFEGDVDPDTVMGSGDVKYHKGCEGEHVSPSGARLDLTLASNPSHLEAVDPVVEGIARAKQSQLGPTGHHKVLAVLVHGDAAFAGQGVVAETLNLSQLPGYRTGGTVHLVINNGIGFTTAPEDARSTYYATDVAKMVQAPIFHVNGDDPEACVRVVALAFEYRQAFHKDVVIDMICYRRHGHNEADEPSYTQPRMYEKIEARRSVRKLYTERLVNRGDITLDEAEAALDEFKQLMQTALEETRQEAAENADVVAVPQPPAEGVLPHAPTGADRAALDTVVAALSEPPENFHVHAKLERFIADRSTQLDRDAVDWALGEALAFGTLLLEGHTVRLSGQDSRRGTFSQRHLVLTDFTTEETWTPLARVARGDSHFRVFDSLLSEYAALGFEYGYSVERPDALVMWEAQFGDFSNGAQIIIDQFIAAAEDKWEQTSGLVMLLPHGYEGQGPEHSSARLERFLQACAEDNMQVVAPTTPAQYFHVLRRQLHRDVRKPLVVMTPKSLLRLPAARSAAADFEGGRSFQEVIGDTSTDPSQVTSLLLCSGKVYYDLAAHREKTGRDDVAIVRVEQLYPFPAEQLRAVVQSYTPGIDVCWVQEEPDNMGPWTHVRVRRQRFLDDGVPLRRVARAGSGSPATGSAAVHTQELERLLRHAFDPSTARNVRAWD